MIDDLRIHAARESRPRTDGELVLYWMQTTQRVQHNFALEFAIKQANQLRVPVLVYHGPRHDYPWASDRIHTFILETVVDLYREFEARGVQYAFYLERTGDDPEARRLAGKPSPLVELARRAALVVTDFFPTFIVPRQIKALRSKIDTPVVAVDSSTVVPMKCFAREHATAHALRVLEHFNNTYALDGRDPNSYAGIHWIFGKFDRPFYRRPIYGTVRYQSLKAAEKKFDVAKYVRRHSATEDRRYI